MPSWWKKRFFPFLLIAIGFAFTIALGVLNGNEEQPSRSTSALLVVVSGIFQLAGAATFNKFGKADPTLAESSIRRLRGLGERAGEARTLCEEAFESGANAGALRQTVGVLSVQLSFIEEGLVYQIEDWRLFHEETVKKLEEGTTNV